MSRAEVILFRISTNFSALCCKFHAMAYIFSRLFSKSLPKQSTQYVVSTFAVWSLLNFVHILPYIGNHLQKKTFTNFAKFWSDRECFLATIFKPGTRLVS